MSGGGILHIQLSDKHYKTIDREKITAGIQASRKGCRNMAGGRSVGGRRRRKLGIIGNEGRLGFSH